jgi:hypothetical protein
MTSDTDLDPPVSHAVAEGWANFAEVILPVVGGDEHAQAHIAFHFGALYVLQIIQQIVADRSVEGTALALGVLDAELEAFMKAHAIVVQ